MRNEMKQGHELRSLVLTKARVCTGWRHTSTPDGPPPPPPGLYLRCSTFEVSEKTCHYSDQNSWENYKYSIVSQRLKGSEVYRKQQQELYL